jgi:hypothetical protein
MTKTFAVVRKGVGRRDYSSAVEYASQPTVKGFQGRNCWAADYTDVPTLPFGDAYSDALGFYDAAGALTYEAPADIINHIYYAGVSSSRKALVNVGLYQFASYADYLAWNVEKVLGWVNGYGIAELEFTTGINTEAGKTYAILFGEYSEEVTFDMRYTVNALEEEVIL